MKRSLLLLFAVIAVFTALPSSLFASHIMGADLTYQYAGRDGAGHMQYKITVNFYRGCCSGCLVAGPSSMLYVHKPNGLDSVAYIMSPDTCPGGCEVPELCPALAGSSTCQNFSGAYPGAVRYRDTITITLPDTCSGWIVGWADGARIATISNLQNPSAQNVYIEATINNTIDPATGSNYIGDAPVFEKSPLAFLCLNAGGPSQYLLNAVATDHNGDSLSYTLQQPLTDTHTPITYSPGYTLSQPMSSSIPCTFDATRGVLDFRPVQTEVDVLSVCVKKYRRGILVGSIMRDINVTIFNCTLNPATPGHILPVQNVAVLDSQSVSSCPGMDMILDIAYSDPSGRSLDLSSTIQSYPGAFPGMSFAVRGSGSLDTARITWHMVDTSCRYVSVTETTSDCPLPATLTSIIRICGRNSSVISTAYHADVYCGTPVTLMAAGGTNFTWSPSAGLSNTTGATTYASPASATTYYLHSDCATDSIHIGVRPRPSYTISHDTALCGSNFVKLHLNMLSPGQYTYLWTPATGLYDSLGGHLNSTISNPTAGVSGTQVYLCVVSDTSGCTIIDSVSVSAIDTGGLHVVANPISVAPGGSTTLYAGTSNNVLPCTTISATSAVASGTAQIGTGTSVQGGSAIVYPSPYGNYYKSARHQLLFKAAELRAALGSSRIISSFSMDIGVLNSGATLSNFTISITCVNLDSLVGYAPASLHTVYQHTYTVVTGWNTHTFDSPYVWDGISDIVVDMCFSNTTSNNLNSKMRYTTTPFRSVWCTFGNGVPMCSITGTQPVIPAYATNFQRPNVRFGTAYQTGPSILPNLHWLPDTGANAVASPTANPTTAHPSSTQWYTAIINNSNCIAKDSARVTVVPNSNIVHHNQDTTVCAGMPVLLIASGGLNYRWTDSLGQTLSLDSAFVYTATASMAIYLHITDIFGVSYLDTTHISVPSVTISPTDTTLNSSGDTVIIHASQASSYAWSADGFLISTLPSVSITAIYDTAIAFMGVRSGCVSHDTCRIHIATLVWPGDANDDHIVDIYDVLNMALAYEDTGSVRPGASIAWTGQPVTVWDSSFANGLSCAFADCNGDGAVNFGDTSALILNWSLTHNKTNAVRQGNTPLYISTDKNLYHVDDTIKVSLSIGDIAQPIPSIYGLAYSFSYTTSSACRTLSIDQSSSWIKSRLPFMNTVGAETYLAQSRINHKDTSGYGSITHIDILVDSLHGTSDSVTIQVSDILGITSRGDSVLFHSDPVTVQIRSLPAGIPSATASKHVQLFPNPNNGSFNVTLSDHTNTRMTVINELGQTVFEQQLTEISNDINTGKLPVGIYTAIFTSTVATESVRLIIR